MEIKNTTKFSKEAYYTLNKTLNSKIYLACILFELVLLGLTAFFIFKNHDYTKAVAMGILMIAYPFILLITMKTKIDRNYKMNELVFKNMSYNYLFTDEEVHIQIENGTSTNETHLSYKSIYKVMHSDKYIFIFISSNQAFLVDKSCFENDNDNNIIIEKFKSEYIKCNYKKVNVKVK